ncbi:MAG: hypothetical protein EPN97_14690 [Alphaproteobacteria bacterium]|nr:MAG: hypothetical protein EPN97_14690 [Alphaproteobacteria bacterium]
MAEEWIPLQAEIIKVEKKNGEHVVEFRDAGLKDTTIIGFPEGGFRQENGACFVKLGIKAHFIKMAEDMPDDPCPSGRCSVSKKSPKP